MNTQLFIVPQLLEGVGPINAAAKKMAEQMGTDDPREVFRRINSGEWVVSAAKPTEMPVWKTVKLGTCKTPDEYRKALKKAGRRIGDWGGAILGRISCSQEETDFDLVALSVGDLGFKDGARYADICAKAIELGLELCPAEVGPALRLQYGDQPKGEWLHIAMEAITDRDGDFYIFRVEHDDAELWIYGYYGHSVDVWSPGLRFVFGRRK
ncbi:MAG: hypothetical protein ACYC4I_00345 [Minisyncoccota bacterium]